MQRNNKNITYLFVFAFFHFLTPIKSENSTVLNSVYPWLRLPRTPQLPSPHHGQYAPINNISIWYTIYGPENGAPVLFVHGGLANSDYWGLQVQQLQSTYKCILIDSRAQGRSPSSSTNITYDLMTSDVISLLDYLGFSKVHLVGWSDGANIGLNLAMNHPNRLYSLFAFGGNYKTSDSNDTSIPPVFVVFMQRAQAEYEKFNPGKQYDILLNDILTLWRSYPKWTKVDFEKIPSDLPVQIVDGDHDEVIPRNQTDTMATWIPQAGELILPRTSHFAMIQDPIMFTTALEQFLAEATNATTCPNYRFVCNNNCSGISASSFYTLGLVIAFLLMLGYAG
jgi:pimeloyl-ACP methyl ester carboxylesterase